MTECVRVQGNMTECVRVQGNMTECVRVQGNKLITLYRSKRGTTW